MPDYRSKTSTHGRNMAGARALWRATGVKDDDFGKPIIAIANSFTQFVPGHVHLKDMGQLVAREIEKAGGIANRGQTIEGAGDKDRHGPRKTTKLPRVPNSNLVDIDSSCHPAFARYEQPVDARFSASAIV